MNATRTRSTSSKKSASKRGRSATSGNARSGRGAAAKSSRTQAGAASSARKSATKRGAKGGVARKSGSAPRAGSSSRSGAAPSRTSRTPIAQAIDLLTEDHRKVQKLFRQAERAKEKPEQLRAIVEEACAALTQHAEIEEEYFYPVMQQSIKETDLIAEAEVEHASARQLIAQLESGDPQDEQYAATFTVLGEYTNHHIKEEQDEIFPKAKRARGDFQPLLDALMTRGEPQPAGRARSGAQAQDEEASMRRARGRQGRGRASARESQGEAEGGEAQTPEGGDVEQPRRARRGEALDAGETESTGRGREQESIEQEERGSRRGS